MNKKTTTAAGAKRVSETQGKKFLQEAFYHEQTRFAPRNWCWRRKASPIKANVMMSLNDISSMTLRAYLPKRYAVDSAHCHRQRRQDERPDGCGTFVDPQYTPTLLDQHDHKYVTAEAVYAVMEVKPTVNKGLLDYAGRKAALGPTTEAHPRFRFRTQEAHIPQNLSLRSPPDSSP